jgi:hypothetical protein
MAHKLISEEMVEKAFQTFWDVKLPPNTMPTYAMRAALEAVADDLIEVCIERLVVVQCPKDEEDTCMRCSVGALRHLKSQGQ